MESWGNFYGQKQIIEPPPELPVHRLHPVQSPKEVAGKRLVKKFKGWFSGRRNDEWYSIPDYLVQGRYQDGESEAEDNYWRRKFLEVSESDAENPDGEFQRLAIQESAKTFLTGNNNFDNHLPEFPAKRKNHNLVRKQSYPDLSAAPDSSSMPEASKKQLALAISERQKLGGFSTSAMQPGNITLHKLSKRLNSIGSKKLECSKLIRKFLKDLNSWGEKTISDNIDVVDLVRELDELFQQDLLLEQRIYEKLEVLTSGLDFIGRRESEMSDEKKHLLVALKKYDNCKERRGDNDEETNLLKERVMAHEKSYETYQANYQYAISVGARQLFKEVAIEFHERASDLKESSTVFLLSALKALETTHNNELFFKDLDKLRKVRAERNWTKLKPEQKSNPQAWTDLVSGKYDNEDTLMKKVYEGLPYAYTPMPEASPGKTPKLDFRTGLEESLSGIRSDKFNPITSNEFFLDKSPSDEDDDQDESNYETVRPEKVEELVNEETIPRSLNPNVLNQDRNSILSLRRPTKDTAPQGKAENTDKNSKGLTEAEKAKYGFLLNFGEMSRQFKDAERHLQENKWTEPSG